jgi:hypothetical protein
MTCWPDTSPKKCNFDMDMCVNCMHKLLESRFTYWQVATALDGDTTVTNRLEIAHSSLVLRHFASRL